MKTTLHLSNKLAGRIIISCLLLFISLYILMANTAFVCPVPGNTALFELNSETTFCTGDTARYAASFSVLPVNATFDFYWDINLDGNADPGEFMQSISPGPSMPSTLFSMEINASHIGGRILVVYKDQDCPNDSLIRVDLVNPVIYDCGARIDDPCTCLNNASSTENGQFSETVVVTSLPGETWEVVSATGLYQIGAAVPATPADLILPGTLLTAGINNFEYELQGVHVDATGYSLVVTNGTDTLSISNRCYYPNPVINLFTDYCINHPIIDIEVTAPPYTGTFSVTINGNPATQFNPAVLGLGVHQVIFEFNANPINDTLPGCIQRDTMFVDVFPNYSGGLACTDINVSLLQEGYVVITPDMVLLGNYRCYSTFLVDITGKDADTLFCEDVGQVFMVRITDPIRNNSCWATVTPEDKSAPLFNCADTTIFCGTDIFALPPDAFISVEDNCDLASVVLIAQGPLTLAPCNPDIGASITRTYRATDWMGNSSTCSHTIFFGRPELGEIVGPENVVLSCGPDLDLSPEALGFPNVDGMPITALCRFSVNYMDMPFITCEGSQTFNRMWTVVDVCGGGGVGFIQVVQVVDNVGPVITCPEDLMLPNAPGLCSAEYMIPTPVMTDNCASDASLSLLVLVNGFPAVPGAIVSLNGGINIIEYIGSDPCGNSSSCEQIVTVIDGEAPTATCNDITVSLDAMGEAILDVADLTNIYIDNCAVTEVLIAKMEDPLVFGTSVIYGCDEVGENMLVVQFSDAAGNVNTCMITVTVQDNLGPTLVFCPMNETIECDGGIPPVVDPVFTDNCLEDITVDFVPVFVPSCPNTGVLTRTWTATDQMGNTAVCTQVITIEDTDPPILVCETDVVIELDENGQATISADQVVVSVMDACSNVTLDFNPPAYDCEDLGVNVLIITATDECSNATGCAVNVEIVDNLAPVFVNCNPAENILLSSLPDCDPDTFLDPDTYGISATDNCDGALVVDPGIFQMGTFEDFCENPMTPNEASGIVEFTVTDSEGNMSTCTFELTVENDIDPLFTTCVANVEVILDANGDASIIQSDVAVAIFPLDCNTIESTLSVTPDRSLDFTCADALLSPINVTFTATLCTGNSAICVVEVTVTDDELPSIVCPPDIDVDCGTSLDVSITGNATIDDNCLPGLMLSSSDDLPVNINCGILTRTFTVTDASGNTNTCEQTITIEDNELPVLTCQDITVSLDADGNGTADLNSAVLLITDNCTVNDFTFLTANPIFDCSDIGANMLIISVADNCGNIGTCEINIEVEDNIAPVITTCNDISINFNDAGSCDLTDVMIYIENNLSILDIDATDNCATVFDTTLNLLPGTIDLCNDPNFPAQATLNYEAVVDDGNGNTDNCEFSISVEYTSVPVFTVCPAIVNLELDNDGVVIFNAAAHVTAVDAGICALPVSYSPLNIIFDCDDLGLNPVAVTASICTGASAVCNLTVNVTNPFVPVVTCPGDILLPADENCEAFLSPSQILALTPNVDFNCDANVVITRADGLALTDPFEPGMTIINIVVNLQGNAPVMCEVTVTVEDETDPVFVNCTPRIILHSTLADCNPTDPEAYNLQATDNCDPGPAISFLSIMDNKDFCDNPNPGLQLYDVVFAAEDVSGNTAVCTLGITIFNDIDPVFTVCQDISLMVNMAGMTSLDLDDVAVAAFTGACNMDFSLDLPPVLNFDCEDVGENDFTVTATLCDGRTATCDFTVTVSQSGEFNVTCPEDTTIFCETNLVDFYADYLPQFMEMGACVEDTDINIEENIDVCGTGTITITFTGTASNGDQVSCETIVNIIIDPDDDFEFEDVSWPVNFNSNCGDINPLLTGSPTVPAPLTCVSFLIDFEDVTLDPDQNGCEVIERTWTVTETCRNQTQVNTQIITRPLPDIPVQSGPPLFTSVNNLPSGDCEIEVILPEVTGPSCATDIIITNNFNGGGANASGLYPVGITEVVFTLTNSCGEMSTYTIEVEVRDLRSPIANCSSNANGLCSEDFEDLVGLIEVVITESCPFTIDTIVTPNLSNCGVGTITVRFIATDQSQNTGTCERVITVSADPEFTFEAGDVNFPADIDLPCDGVASTDITGTPEILIESLCADFSVTFEDDITVDPGTGCTTIERTWFILEACTAVTIDDTQIITIAGPGIEIAVIAAEYNENAPSDACEVQVDIPILSVVGCAGGVTIVNNSPYADSNGADASGVYPVGTTVFVFTVTNNCGGMGTFEVTVNVFDVTDPEITCPETDPIICTDDILAYISTLSIGATDACGIASTDTIVSDIDFDCGDGTLPVDFIVTDFSGNTASCQVIIEFIPDLIEESDITWPADYSLSCNESDEPVNTGMVSFGPNCSKIGVEFEDADPTTDPFGCPVFIRSWTVIDTCQVLPGAPGSGEFTHEQLIYQVDYSEIEALVPNDTLIQEEADPIDCQAFVDLIFPLPDYCAPDVVVENSYNAGGADASDFYPVGVTVVTYTISNSCGVLFTEEAIISIEDLQSPELDCEDLPTSVSCTADLDAIIDGWVFTVIESCPHDTTLIVNTSGLSNCGVGTLSVTLEIVDIGNNGASCTRNIQVTAGVQVFDPNDIVWPEAIVTLDDCGAVTTPEALNSFPILTEPYNCLNITFTFEDETPDPEIDPENCLEIERTWTATNLCSGEIEGTFVQLILINANFSPIVVGGKIVDNSDNGPLNSAIVNLGDTRIAMSVKTNQGGQYNFSVSPQEESIRIQPSAFHKRKNKVNAIDLNLLIQHLYGGAQMQEPWRRVAADVDKSGNLSDNDLFQIRALILGEISQFHTGNWKFIPRTITDSLHGPDAWMNRPEFIDLPLSESNAMNKNDFRAVELGKLYIQTLSQTRDRNAKPKHNWLIAEQVLKSGQSTSIPFYADNANELKAFQFTLSWDSDNLIITEVIPGNGLSAANFSTKYSSDGKLTVCWGGENARLSDNEPAFTIVVMPKLDFAGLGEVFEITGEITEALSFFGGNDEKVPALSIINQKHSYSNNYELFQNNPNPFSEETWITFKVPVDEMVTITITDLTGKIVHQQKQFCLKGKHAVKVEFGSEFSEGMYLYRIETDAFSATKKMLKIGE